MSQVDASRVNGIDMSVLKETIGAIQQDPELANCHFRVRNTWIGANRNRTQVQDFHAARGEQSHKKAFTMECDEPPMLAGTDEGANPVEHLLHALAGCVTTSMVAHAAVRGIQIEELESEIEGDIDLRGFLGLAPEVPKGYTSIRMNFRVKSDADPARLKKLAEFSPVFNTITDGAKVDISVQKA